ncbi:hypothetical protein AB1K84_20000 [Mesobacillus foraminis]|uniref:hypothetical protein n=1 Tax=Mesobacillus foraminis TaxID=279826 RepID=UPI0039A310CE
MKGGIVLHQANEDPSGGSEGRKPSFIKTMKTQEEKVKGGKVFIKPMKTQAEELKGGIVFHPANEDPSGGSEGRKRSSSSR